MNKFSRYVSSCGYTFYFKHIFFLKIISFYKKFNVNFCTIVINFIEKLVIFEQNKITKISKVGENRITIIHMNFFVLFYV